MQTYGLNHHPATPPLQVSAITARLTFQPYWLHIRWRIEGAQGIVVPPPAGRLRADGLWQTTCFELFVEDGEGYREFNLSPSERWAAYRFDRYREGMANLPMPREPVVAWRGGGAGLAIFDADIPLAGLPALPARIGLCAVIEETDGAKSYWAVVHPPGKPDFHASTCFAQTLAAPQTP